MFSLYLLIFFTTSTFLQLSASSSFCHNNVAWLVVTRPRGQRAVDVLFRDIGLTGSELAELADVTGVTHVPGDNRPPADLGESSLEWHSLAPFAFRLAGPGLFLSQWQGDQGESHHKGGVSLCLRPAWQHPLVKSSDTTEPGRKGQHRSDDRGRRPCQSAGRAE